MVNQTDDLPLPALPTSEPDDFSDLVARYQVLCAAISYWEEMSWSNPALQQWLLRNQLSDCRGPWQLPPSALWVVVQSLESKLEQLTQK